MENALKPSAKSLLIPLRLTEAASAAHAAIHKKMFERQNKIFFNKKMNDIMKIVKYLEKSGLLIKDVSETIKNEAKEQKKGISQYVIRNIGASLLGNLLTG